MISPSTLRYIQNALDISYFYGEGDLNKIVEIGGGYGGLCKTINCLCDFGEYHIYDMEPASVASLAKVVPKIPHPTIK